MDKYIDQLKPVFEKVAEKIGEGTAYVWTIYIKQQYIFAAEGLFASIIGLILLIVSYKLLKKGNAVKKESDNYDDSFMIYYIFATIFLISGFLTFIFGCDTAITHFINPQYYALQDLIGIVKPSN